MSTLQQVPGFKIGMTQVYDDARKAIPVTVIECGQWFVTQIKTEEKDGYAALQIGILKKRYRENGFAPAMLAKKANFFAVVREVRCDDVSAYTVGQAVSLGDGAFELDSRIHVTGTSIGKGFQGVVKRWNFAGGKASHGNMMGRRPGSIGNMASQGKVIKGKKLPGQMGNKQITVKGLRVVQVDAERGIILVEGAVPGRKNSLLYLRKQG